MTKVSPKTIAHLLRSVATMFDNDQCGLDDEEMAEVVAMFTHRKMNIEQTCQYFGISRATLNRWQQSGKLPQFRKDCGGKDYLYQDECDEYIAKYNNCLPNNPM